MNLYHELTLGFLVATLASMTALPESNSDTSTPETLQDLSSLKLSAAGDLNGGASKSRTI